MPMPGTNAPARSQVGAVMVKRDAVARCGLAADRVFLGIGHADQFGWACDVALRRPVLAEGAHGQRQVVVLEHTASDGKCDEIARVRTVDHQRRRITELRDPSCRQPQRQTKSPEYRRLVQILNLVSTEAYLSLRLAQT